MKKIFLVAALTLLCLGAAAQMKVSRIWDKDYCAFPGITLFQGRYYVIFREGRGHVFDENGKAEGKIRILRSEDGSNWNSVALLGKEGFDLRDPKLSVTPDGCLMASIGGSFYRDKVLEKRIPHVSFSADGLNFSDPEPVSFDWDSGDEFEWLWRVTWHEGTGYTVTYGNHFALLKTTDGRHYEMVAELPADGQPNETTIRFTPDGRMAMMIRREKDDRRGWWGISAAPYTEWNFVPMDLQLGGPEFLIREDGSVIAGTRSYFIGKKPKTILLKGGLDGIFEEVCVLPSGGDTSYPGFITVGDELWVVYYSSHELGRAAIYLARIPLTMFD